MFAVSNRAQGVAVERVSLALPMIQAAVLWTYDVRMQTWSLTVSPVPLGLTTDISNWVGSP